MTTEREAAQRVRAMLEAGQRPSLWRVLLGAFRRRSRDADRDHAWTDRLAFRDQMAAGGYVEWASVPPPLTDDPVECRRFEWPRGQILRPAKAHPAMNTVGLFWRSHGPTIETARRALSDNPTNLVK